MPPVDLPTAVRAVIRKLRHARLHYNEALEDHGDNSREFLWEKCKVETIEEVLFLMGVKNVEDL